MSALLRVVSYGGGTNSAAMLVGMRERGERPDAIVFADTGGEKPHTYGHLWIMQPWCEAQGFPSIQIVRGEQPQQVLDGTLEQECLRLAAIPSRAFGFGQCSDKWKIDPFNKWCAQHVGLEYVKAIGFHAGEAERCYRVQGRARYPLIEWGWDYEDCEAAILRADLPLPGKSACYYCPSTRPADILELRRRYPDLLERALAMEARWLKKDSKNGGGSVKGLGRRWSWAEILRDYDAQPDLFGSTPECFT